MDFDETAWTASEAAKILAPHLTPAQARALIRAAALTPRGWRHSSSFRGRKAATYDARDLITLFAVLDDLAPQQQQQLADGAYA